MSGGVAPELVERMVACLRRGIEFADKANAAGGGVRNDTANLAEAREIVALLPEPVDPDIAVAAELCRATGWMFDTSFVTDSGSGMALAYAAIKRGRELAQGAPS